MTNNNPTTEQMLEKVRELMKLECHCKPYDAPCSKCYLISEAFPQIASYIEELVKENEELKRENIIYIKAASSAGVSATKEAEERRRLKEEHKMMKEEERWKSMYCDLLEVHNANVKYLDKIHEKEKRYYQDCRVMRDALIKIRDGSILPSWTKKISADIAIKALSPNLKKDDSQH
jgi:hypothetical protein